MNPFVAGQEVVCINDRSYLPEVGVGASARSYGLHKGKTYTISRVEGPWVGILGIQGTRTLGDIGWHYSRFRPVQKRRTDAAVEELKKLLNVTPQSKKVVETA